MLLIYEVRNRLVGCLAYVHDERKTLRNLSVLAVVWTALESVESGK
jgi:hypothetical protein